MLDQKQNNDSLTNRKLLILRSLIMFLLELTHYAIAALL